MYSTGEQNVEGRNGDVEVASATSIARTRAQNASGEQHTESDHRLVTAFRRR